MPYEEFFNLKEAPFRLTPDPDYYFPSDVHKEALETMIYSIRAGEGFVQISGEPGIGKTLLIRTLLRRLGESVNLALILNPALSPDELMRVILDDLGGINVMETAAMPKEKVLHLLRDYLLEKAHHGKKTIIIVDEAQNLPNETMEELRLLSNLETEKEKLLQIILVGQLELEEKLKGPGMKQLAQRITIRYRLTPLSKVDTAAYIRHRLEVAGGGDGLQFSQNVLSRIYKYSHGVPRRINIVCERSLMAAFVDGDKAVSKQHIESAIKSIEGEEMPDGAAPAGRRSPLAVALAVILLVALGAGGAYYYLVNQAARPPAMDQLAIKKEVEQERKKQLTALEQELAVHKQAAEKEIEKSLETSRQELATQHEKEMERLRSELAAEQDRQAREKESLSATIAELTAQKARSLEDIALQESLARDLAAQRRKLAQLDTDFQAKEKSIKEELGAERQKRLTALEAELAEQKKAAEKEIEKSLRTSRTELSQLQEKEKERLGRELAAERERLVREKEALAASIAELSTEKERIIEDRRKEEIVAKESEKTKRTPLALMKAHSIDIAQVEKNQSRAASPQPTEAGVQKPAPAVGAGALATQSPDQKQRPREAVHVPARQYFLVINRLANKGYLWQGKDPEPKISGEFDIEWPLTDGIFMLGRRAETEPFVFTPSSFLWGTNRELAIELLRKIGKQTEQSIIPVLVYSGPAATSSIRPENYQAIPRLISSLAEAWRAKNLEGMMSFYGPMFTHYEIDNNRPVVFANTSKELRALHKDIFDRCGSISLQYSEPFYLVDPSDPKTAVAVFEQNYRSDTYSDNGYKALYLRHIQDAGGTPVWKIVAKLWLPKH